MTIRAAIATILACTVSLAVISGGIGWGLGKFAPGYYRSVFPNGNEPRFDPLDVGVGQGLTQGATGEVIVGVIVVILFVWRESRVRHGGRNDAIPKTDTSKTPLLDFQPQPRPVQHDPQAVQHVPPQKHP